MSAAVPYLLVALALYLSLAAWAGYGRRWQLFGAAILGGMGLNQLWMMLALDARPFEIHALIAQGSLLLYGLTAGGAGLLVGRLARQLRGQAVDSEVAKD